MILSLKPTPQSVFHGSTSYLVCLRPIVCKWFNPAKVCGRINFSIELMTCESAAFLLR
ncbi:hypothetical protein LMG24238_00620 [Paraburkholderia sediminicola]|uniref:Uncharacterized protein n=1 Tax=Paraburkholderia sediminicola TaxID=458836 RepID=A0A6J4ZVS2_9BURK|nr:hypothetical protein LMG24238_00620 [Paraburkholderia sediminicola]